MLKLLALLISLAGAQEAPPSYLVFPTPAEAIARTEAQCVQYGCTGTTDYWWAVQELTDGTAALVIQASGPYGPSANIGPCTANCGLTAAEVTALKSAADLGTRLPDPSTPMTLAPSTTKKRR